MKRHNDVISYKEELKKVAEDYEIPLIIIKEMESGSSLSKFFIDYAHPTQLGHQ